MMNLTMQNFPYIRYLQRRHCRNASTIVVLFKVVFLHAVKVSEILRQQLVAATFDKDDKVDRVTLATL